MKGRPEQYESEMQYGRGQYADIVDELNERGLPTVFTQTGGMNAALECRLETGDHLLITDAMESLSWQRSAHRGWGVGLYRAGYEEDGPQRFACCEDSGLEELLSLIRAVLL